MRLALPRLVVLACAFWASAAAALPSGFVLEDAAPGAGFEVPTSIAFFPDGRFLVGEKSGQVWVVQGTAKRAAPMWDGRNEVLDIGDAGFTGVAVDPNYATNRYIYFSYCVDPDSDGVDYDDVSFGRLVRYQTSLADPNVVDPGTRTILLGTTWSDGVPNGSRAHTIDGIRWGTDGSLLISAGDGGYFHLADIGGLYPNLFLPGRVDPYEDIGSFRSQYVGSLCGKILRIDPATGLGYPSNPYFDGNPASHRSKVWAYGLRNPWRFGVRPGTGNANPANGQPGTIYVGNVGWAEWEGIGVSRVGGENFGWPCYENGHIRPEFQSPSPAHSGCDSLGTWGNPATSITAPIISLSHSNGLISTPPGYTGNSITGGLFYTGSVYPAAYQSRYFFADYPTGQVWSAGVNATDQLLNLSQFDYDRIGPVDLADDPFVHDLYYVAVVTGQVMHIRYLTPLPGDHLPVPVASAGNAFGPPPLSVSFSSAGTLDVDGDSLALSWNFGDGKGSISPSPSHTYTVAGSYQAVLTADDRRGGVARDTVIVIVPQSFDFPSTPDLDSFDRANAPLGAPWLGDLGSLAVDDSALVLGGASGIAVWGDSVFGPNQEAYARFNTLPQDGSFQALVLLAQGASESSARLRVRMDAEAGEVFVETYNIVGGWGVYGDPIPITLLPGDQLGARVYANGIVQVLQNGAILATTSIGDWPYIGQSGRIGLELEDPGSAHLDDFGGGDAVLNGNQPPYAFLLSPLDGSFYAAGDTIILAGSALDDADPIELLKFRWDVDVHHNNHIHPDVVISTAPTVAFLAEDHDDGTGVHYRIQLSVTDTEGRKGVHWVDIWPKIDLTPGPVVTVPDTVNPSYPTAYSFVLQNLGKMQAPYSHWQITLDGVTVAQGDTTVPALQSIVLGATALPPGLAPGWHTLRVVVDTLGAVRELQEGNNASTRQIYVGAPVAGVSAAPRSLAFSEAQPNPARGVARFRLDLPRPARVEFSIFDVAGRRVWGGADRDYGPGSWSLDWSGRSLTARAGAGLYFARVRVEGRTFIRRVVMLN